MMNMTRLGPRPMDEGVVTAENTHTAESEEVDLAEVRVVAAGASSTQGE